MQALASTIKRDPTAAHYKYHDDPYLIPYSNFTKRSYALSQESGRKAARWVRQQHKKLFNHKIAEPLIEVNEFTLYKMSSIFKSNNVIVLIV